MCTGTLKALKKNKKIPGLCACNLNILHKCIAERGSLVVVVIVVVVVVVVTTVM